MTTTTSSRCKKEVKRKMVKTEKEYGEGDNGSEDKERRKKQQDGGSTEKSRTVTAEDEVKDSCLVGHLHTSTPKTETN